MTLKNKLSYSFSKLPFINTYGEAEKCAELFLEEMIRLLESRHEQLSGEFDEAKNGSYDQLTKAAKSHALRDYLREIKKEARL